MENWSIISVQGKRIVEWFDGKYHRLNQPSLEVRINNLEQHGYRADDEKVALNALRASDER